ncbi:MAG: hypothetical protein IJV35_05230 [Neisseriaceae bacterium]|nr:hypothetical protein [Neisseriaceae bacterium]
MSRRWASQPTSRPIGRNGMMIRKWFRLPENAKSNAYRRCWWVENPPYGVTVFVFQPEKNSKRYLKINRFA